MKTHKINDKILAVEFPNRKEITLTMFRIAEYYESPFKEIKDSIFTIDKWLEKYIFIKYGKDKENYFEYWDGFNLPVEKAMDSFFMFENESQGREYKFLDEVAKVFGYDNKDGYVICYTKGDKITLKHELCHALYYTNQDYKKEVNEVIKKMNKNLKDKYIQNLKKDKYTKEVFIDEINAYITAFSSEDYSNIKKRDIIEVNKELNKILKKYN